MPTRIALDRVLAGRTPEVFGRYELLGRLGVGGMAEVFVARTGEVAGMRSLVALKRILPHFAGDERFIAMFQREARIALRLHHRAISRVVEVGRVGDAWFLAMELVPGESLADVIRAQREAGVRPEPALVAYVGAELAAALQVAHDLRDVDGTRLGVVHRDVSPQNVLVGFDGAVKLIDFGVARCRGEGAGSRAGTVRGKIEYVAPEQVAGRPLDGRADVFSLGVLLYEWLAGRSLFQRDDDAATLKAVLSEAVPPLFGDAAVRAMSAPLLRALERDPGRRHESAEAFRRALLAAAGSTEDGSERLAALAGELFPDRRAGWTKITELAPAGARLAPMTEAATPADGGTAHGTVRTLGATGASRTPGRARRVARTWKALGFGAAVVALGGVLGARGFRGGDAATSSTAEPLRAVVDPLAAPVAVPGGQAAAPSGPAAVAASSGPAAVAASSGPAAVAASSGPAAVAASSGPAAARPSAQQVVRAAQATRVLRPVRRAPLKKKSKAPPLRAETPRPGGHLLDELEPSPYAPPVRGR